MSSSALASRLSKIKPSPTIMLSTRAKELKAQGRDVINLTVGEPDFDTPNPIKEAAIKAIHDGDTKYTAVDGTPALKQAIINKFKNENKLIYEPNQILVSCGAKHSIYNVAQALLNPGDEAIIPTPYWVSYPDIVRLAGAEITFISTGIAQNFKVLPEQLEKAITPKTKLFFLNSPSNPTGVAYTEDELKGLASVLINHPNVYILTDDIYEHILWKNKPFKNILNVCPELYDRTIVINGVSKAYAMTGWRIGYAASNAELIAGMRKIQSQCTSSPCSISQAASTAALQIDYKIVEKMVSAYHERHHYIFQELSQIPGIQIKSADGTFYTFPDLSEIIEIVPQFNNDVDMAEFLLNEAEIAIVPGSAFGQPGCIRISFATSLEDLKKAISRIKDVFKNFA